MEETLVNVGAIAVVVIMIVAMWKVFTKAGQPGWATLIPIYNCYVMLKIASMPGWFIILMFIPIVNLVIGIMATIALAAKFGKSFGFAIGMLFLPFIFFPILAFGNAQYQVE